MHAQHGIQASARRPRAAGRAAFRAAALLVRVACVTCFVALGLAATGCRPHSQETTHRAMFRPPFAEVLARHTPELMALPGVVGTYQGADTEGQPLFVVMIARDDPALRARIPASLEGWPVRAEVSGDIRAFGDSAR